MSYCCSQCNLKANFESALTMHHQLHHKTSGNTSNDRTTRKKLNTVPREPRTNQPISMNKENKGLKLLARTSSATRLFDKLRARLSKSKVLLPHPEETANGVQNDNTRQSECSSKMLKDLHTIEPPREIQNETFGCHLCSFDADRITVLDRHLLNDHKIGLDNLLKLVMAKTKDGLAEDSTNKLYEIRQPYYKPSDEIVEEGEFVIETVTPKIKILKHASINTDLKWTDIPNLEHCKNISKEIEEIIDVPVDGTDNERLLAKMQILNECMSKFVNSSNTLNKVLTKEFSHKNLGRLNERFFDLGLGDQDSSRERLHSERYEKSRSRFEENRSDKKYSSESFYF